MNAVEVISLMCALSFLGYGTTCLLSAHMVAEFERYGIPQFRLITGLLQLLAALGLVLGLVLPVVGALSAAGLSLQMACGVSVRIRIGDRLQQCLPAAVFMFICGYLAVALIK